MKTIGTLLLSLLFSLSSFATCLDQLAEYNFELIEYHHNRAVNSGATGIIAGGISTTGGASVGFGASSTAASGLLSEIIGMVSIVSGTAIGGAGMIVASVAGGISTTATKALMNSDEEKYNLFTLRELLLQAHMEEGLDLTTFTRKVKELFPNKKIKRSQVANLLVEMDEEEVICPEPDTFMSIAELTKTVGQSL